MINVPVPGWGELSIEYVIVDFNGTAALDGKLKKEVKEVIDKISRYVKVFVITADTYETADSELGPCKCHLHKGGQVCQRRGEGESREGAGSGEGRRHRERGQ